MNLELVQHKLPIAGLDGWLFFDHHERDPLAYRVLGLKPRATSTDAGAPPRLVRRYRSAT
jgi:Xaa-Pro dipeptidase